LADTNFQSEKNFEVENFQLLTMIFSENVLSVENFLEWKWTFTLFLISNQFSLTFEAKAKDTVYTSVPQMHSVL
jgi:hypothetical protein